MVWIILTIMALGVAMMAFLDAIGRYRDKDALFDYTTILYGFAFGIGVFILLAVLVELVL
jgi:hypothetical protein